MNYQEIINAMTEIVEEKVVSYKSDFYTHDTDILTTTDHAQWFWAAYDRGTHLWRQGNRAYTNAVKQGIMDGLITAYAIDLEAGTFEQTWCGFDKVRLGLELSQYHGGQFTALYGASSTLIAGLTPDSEVCTKAFYELIDFAKANDDQDALLIAKQFKLYIESNE